jgi:3-deoxy-D-manno-octulosonate 8-phosphate phosphatase (KDO 8-P phosphatase)
MEKILKSYSQELIRKAQEIKVLITDVDGVLTDGRIIYDDNGLEYKEFSVRDGQIMRFLRNAGIKTGVITGRESQVVINRCKELNFDFHHHGAKNKLKIWDEVINKLGIEEVNVAYVGDDLLDIPLFKKAGLSASPPDAPEYVREKADFILNTKGGRGAFREFADFILAAQGRWESIFNELNE